MQNKQHDLIKTGDPDSFEQIQDRNGEVVLAYCRRCKEAEAGLKPQCPGKPSNPFNKLFLVYRPSGRYFPAFWALMWGTGVAGGVHISGRNIGATQAKPTKRQQRRMLKEWKKSLHEFGDALSRVSRASVNMATSGHDWAGRIEIKQPVYIEVATTDGHSEQVLAGYE